MDAKTCNKKKGIWKDKTCFIPSKIVETGEFISGRKWKKTDSIKVGNKLFKKGQTVNWEDPDFGAYEYDKFQDFKFKIGGFMIYDHSIDILPKDEKGRNVNTGNWENVGLGRISLKDVKEFKKIKGK